MPTLNTRSWRGSSETPISASDDRRARVVVERPRGALVEALAHGGHRGHLGDDHVRALAGRAQRPLDRVVVAAVDARRAPALELEARRDPTRPVVGRRVVVDDDRGEAAEREPAGELDGLPVAALVELGVADQAEHARPPAPARLEAERRAHRDGQAVAERAARDLHPGHEHVIGVVAQRRVEVAEAGEVVDVDEALRGEDRVVGGRAVALGEQEAVALGIVGRARVQAQDAVVEDPQHVERRERAPVVLLVARELGQQRRQIVVVEGRGDSHCRTVGPQLWFKSRMARELTIGELSARSGVSQSALRFYERKGLISAERSSGNQRRYPAHALRRVALVQAGTDGRHPAGAHPRRARHAARGPRADQARLGAALAQLARGARPAHRDARGHPRPPDGLHRLRLPVAATLRAAQPRRRGRPRAAPAPITW